MYTHAQHASIQAIKQPSRRRTRRHQQRLRSVEVTRGRSGYGFTISGQSPCILSCIVAGSPADCCGLKTGDFLISVNGQLISDSPHDDVVRLIGSSRGTLVLQIAENYNTSDSSEDEFQVRPKVNIRSKVRSRGYERSLDDLEALVRHRHVSQPHGKYARDRSLDHPHSTRPPELSQPLQTQENGIENVHPQNVRNVSALKSVQDGVIRYKNGSRTKHTIITREARLGMAKSQSHPEGFSRPLPPTPLSEMNNGLQVNSEPRSRTGKKSLDQTFEVRDYNQAVVGYAGSIEMPHDLTHSRVQAVRGAVRRLRLEQKVHAFVLMELESTSLKLINHMSCTVAAYPPDKLAFAGVCPEDQRFFGIVTLHTSDDSDGERLEVVGSSCHVFFVDPSLALHHLHVSQIENFSIKCTMDPRTQTCSEFPSCAPSLVHAICARYQCAERSHYASEMEQIGTFVAVPSSSSQERTPKPTPSKVCVVEVDTPDSSMNASALSSFSQFSRSSYADDSDCVDSKLQVRAMPNPRGFTSEVSPLEQQNSANNLRRNLHRFMNGGQAPPPRDSQTHVRPVGQLSIPPVCISTPVDHPPLSKPPMVPRTTQVSKERSKSTPPIMKLGCRPIDPPPENLTDDHKRQLTPQPPDYPVKKTSAEDLSTWRSAADPDDPSVVTGSASARPATEDSKSRVAGWAVNFDLLLQDAAGLATFTEYLKKEYSEENIKFWKKCQQYTETESESKRSQLGAAIFGLHLSGSASEPVNVDSHSRSQAQESFHKAASKDVFEQTQKQIFLLMKQDSYPRFLKSDIYKQCIMAEMENLCLPYLGGDEKTPAKLEVPTLNETPVTTESNSKKNMKKSKSSSGTDAGGEEKRRRSLLPWIRNKSEKKLVKAVTESELTRSDKAKSVKVQLPDKVWTAMEFKGHRWTAALRAHCEAHALLYEFLIITDFSGEPVNIKAEECAPQIQLHKAVVFKLEMASRKTVGVKCLPDRTLRHVLSPVLAIYGQSIAGNTVIHVSGTGVVLDDQAEIGSFDGKHLVVQSLDDFKEWGGIQKGSKPPLPKGKAKEKALGTLFKDISSVAFDEHCVWDPDLKHAKSGEKNSGFLDFIRRNSIGEKGDTGRVRKASAHGSQKSLNQRPSSASKKKPPPIPPPTIAPKKKGLPEDQERFLSLLSRTSRQMDDQRGLTPKDLELPDFLKVDKSESPPKKNTLLKTSLHRSDPSLHKADNSATTTGTPQNVSCSQDFLDTSLTHSDKSFSSAGTVPTHEEADRYFSALSSTAGLMDSQGSFADYLNLTVTDHLGSDEECDITLIPPSSSSSSSRANSPPPVSSSSHGSWRSHPLPSSSDNRSTPSPTTHSLILDPSDTNVSFV